MTESEWPNGGGVDLLTITGLTGDGQRHWEITTCAHRLTDQLDLIGLVRVDLEH